MGLDWSKYDLKKAKDLAAKFGKASVAEMMFNIQNMDLVDTGNLMRSVKAGVRTTNNEVDRVQFTYEWYGRFHEVGADNAFGKGVQIKAMHWRSQAIASHIQQLNDDFAQFYAELIADEIQIDSIKMEM